MSAFQAEDAGSIPATRSNNVFNMKNCSKCNSENIKKTGPFALKIKDGKTDELSDQFVNYRCNDCGHEWKIEVL